MSDENSRRHVEYAIVRIQFLNRGTTAGEISFAKNLLKVALEELVISLRHGNLLKISLMPVLFEIEDA